MGMLVLGAIGCQKDDDWLANAVTPTPAIAPDEVEQFQAWIARRDLLDEFKRVEIMGMVGCFADAHTDPPHWIIEVGGEFYAAHADIGDGALIPVGTENRNSLTCHFGLVTDEGLGKTCPTIKTSR